MIEGRRIKDISLPKSRGKEAPGNSLPAYFDKAYLYTDTPLQISDEETLSLDRLARLIKGEFQKMRMELSELNHPNVVKVDAWLSQRVFSHESVCDSFECAYCGGIFP